jgi:hypothetical protein
LQFEPQLNSFSNKPLKACPEEAEGESGEGIAKSIIILSYLLESFKGIGLKHMSPDVGKALQQRILSPFNPHLLLDYRVRFVR